MTTFADSAISTTHQHSSQPWEVEDLATLTHGVPLHRHLSAAACYLQTCLVGLWEERAALHQRAPSIQWRLAAWIRAH